MEVGFGRGTVFALPCSRARFLAECRTGCCIFEVPLGCSSTMPWRVSQKHAILSSLSRVYASAPTTGFRRMMPCPTEQNIRWENHLETVQQTEDAVGRVDFHDIYRCTCECTHSLETPVCACVQCCFRTLNFTMQTDSHAIGCTTWYCQLNYEEKKTGRRNTHTCICIQSIYGERITYTCLQQ